MGINYLVSIPPLERILDILDRAHKVLFELVLGLGVDRGRN